MTDAVLGTFVISQGLQMAQWLEPGQIIVGVYLPYAFDLSGIALGAVIVLTMALRPSGVMGEN